MSASPKKTPIKFARRTLSGRIQSLSREDIDLGPDLTSTSSGVHDDYNYTVHMPPTPDNQPFVGGPKQRAGHRGGDDGGSGGGGRGKLDRRMSVIKTNKSMLMRSQTGDFDHTRFLFEKNKGTYGIGNAYWPADGGGYDDDVVGGMSMDDFLDKPWKPLTRKVRVPPGILSPYRYMNLDREYIQEDRTR